MTCKKQRSLGKVNAREATTPKSVINTTLDCYQRSIVFLVLPLSEKKIILNLYVLFNINIFLMWFSITCWVIWYRYTKKYIKADGDIIGDAKFLSVGVWFVVWKYSGSKTFIISRSSNIKRSGRSYTIWYQQNMRHLRAVTF